MLSINEIVNVEEQSSGAARLLLSNGFARMNPGGRFAQPFCQSGADDIVKLNIETKLSPVYAKACMANNDNPYLPTVLEMAQSNNYTLERVERLESVDPSLVEDAVNSGSYGGTLTNFRQEAEHLSDFLDCKKTPYNEKYFSDPDALKAARVILQASKDILSETADTSFPIIGSIDPGIEFYNIFRRPGAEGSFQYVFGDPLSPQRVDLNELHSNQCVLDINRRLEFFGMEPIR